MDRRDFFGRLGQGAATVAAVGAGAVTSGTLTVRVIEPRHVGIHTREWQDGDRGMWAFDHILIHQDGPQRLNVGDRIRMDASEFKGPIFEGVVTDVDDECHGTNVVWQRIIGVRT
jgi:hypothetical protein